MLEYDKKVLGEFLKEARETAGFTQAEVSKDLGYTSPQFISNIERGISVAPLKTLGKMVKKYKVSHVPVVNIILKTQKQLLEKRLR